ncbi:hypothetical protein [Shewanella litorisediminis]|uniref:Uncharacterized protein n=1 Tax=Shewanella litorisediminis TaxID=1173586 RepID=A0ABX7FZX9_9GAMM|nr:hypothetical protein [Shewanella litorisediminis]MCL2919710.1 hypothetical protein [Shewanella litorisediminis]QRH00594.1 hypothetical protein JQC75_11965 [Shewanella litorisediminis]
MNYGKCNEAERNRFLAEAKRVLAEHGRGIYENQDGSMTVYEVGRAGKTGVYSAERVANDLQLDMFFREGVRDVDA